MAPKSYYLGNFRTAAGKVAQNMRILDRYVLGSILRVTIITVLLCTFMMLVVDLFTNIDNYLTYEISGMAMLRMSILHIPRAVTFVLGPSLLFSVTFFLSMLNANNELISLLNAGIPYRRIIIPILAVGMLASAGLFIFQETVVISTTQERELLSNELFGTRSTLDNRDVTLSDIDGGYVIYASRYTESTKRITSVMVVQRDEEGILSARIDAPYAVFNEEMGAWVFSEATVYKMNPRAPSVESGFYQTYSDAVIDLDPNFFRNHSNDITTMELSTAIQYLKRMKQLSPEQYSLYATEFWERVLGTITPLVLVIIACSMNIRFKKNVLLFSIISSLSVAVVFYVTQMLTLIMAKQGVIAPLSGMIVPMIVVLLFALATSKLISR